MQRKKTLKWASWPRVALPARVQSQPCPWNCHYEFRLFQNPAADGSKGSQLLSGNSSGRSPLNTKKLRCNQPGWNSGKCWLWSLRKKEHISGREEADLPAEPLSPFHLSGKAKPAPPVPPVPAGSSGLQRRATRPHGRAGIPLRWTRMPCDCYFFGALASARNLSVVVSRAKHEPGFSIMVAILACNFITRI